MEDKDRKRLRETRDAVLRIEAALGERCPAQRDRIDKLERNQRWGVLAVFGLVAAWVKGLFA